MNICGSPKEDDDVSHCSGTQDFHKALDSSNRDLRNFLPQRDQRATEESEEEEEEEVHGVGGDFEEGNVLTRDSYMRRRNQSGESKTGLRLKFRTPHPTNCAVSTLHKARL